MRRVANRFAVTVVVALAAWPLGAGAPASPQMKVQAAEPLAAPPTAALPENTPLRKATIASAGGFEAAPIPDEDATGPADQTKPSTELKPTLVSPKSLFSGDGFYHGSSQQSTLDARTPPAPGLGLSVPVQ